MLHSAHRAETAQLNQEFTEQMLPNLQWSERYELFMFCLDFAYMKNGGRSQKYIEEI